MGNPAWLKSFAARPTQVAVAGGLLAVVLLLLVAWSARGVFRAFDELSLETLRLQRLVDRLSYIDEALTTYAHLAGATGETRWILRYRQLEQEFRPLVVEALSLAEDAGRAEAVSELTALGDSLLAAEAGALELIQQGKRSAALQLLTSGEYARWKRLYSEQVSEIVLGIDDEMLAKRALVQQRETLFNLLIAMTFLGFALIGIVVRSALNAYTEAQQSADEATHRLAAIVESSDDAIASKSLDGTILSWNSGAERMFGYTASEVVGKSVFEILPPQSVQQEKEVLEAVRLGSEAKHYDAVRRAKDGRLLHISLSTSPIRNYQGRVVGVATISRDVTAERQGHEEIRASNERYRLVGRATSDTIWDWDIPTSRLVWGDGIHTTFGYPLDEVREDLDWWSSRIHPDDLPGVLSTLEAALAGTGEAWSGEYRFLRADGSYAYVLDRGFVVRDEQGIAMRMIGSISDITARKWAEEQLRQAKDAADAANRAKSDFLSSMSHELRTPLNSVIGFANVLRKNKAGNLLEQDLVYLNRILANGRHLLELINAILDLSKIEAGKMDLEITPVRIDTLVNEVLDALQGSLGGRDVELRAQLPEMLAPVETDAGKLKQILINLVGNAIKFTERGSVTVAVGVEETSRRPTRIDVVDTGIGIPHERLTSIFRPFEQADQSTSRRFGGTGLGLAISRSLASLLGFQLRVRSEEGVGSVFSIDLSRGGDGADRAERSLGEGFVSTATVDPQESGHGLEEPLVLVIDDDIDARFLLTHQIEEMGARAIAASSGEQGIRMAKEFRPDLITLDLMLPDAAGWDVLRTLREDPRLRDIPVIVVSIIASERRASLLGAVDLLDKPVDPEALALVLRRHLLGRSGRALIVDDQPVARLVLATYLQEVGIQSRTAGNGREALQVLEEFSPDLIVLDLLMPELDGITLLRTVRADPRFRHIPIVILTARHLSPEAAESVSREAVALLRNDPQLKADLQEVLREILRRADRSPTYTD